MAEHRVLINDALVGVARRRLKKPLLRAGQGL
jgi:hypothetical protein